MRNIVTDVEFYMTDKQLNTSYIHGATMATHWNGSIPRHWLGLRTSKLKWRKNDLSGFDM